MNTATDPEGRTFYFDPLGKWSISLYAGFGAFGSFLLAVASYPKSSGIPRHSAVEIAFRVGCAALAACSILLWRAGRRLGVTIANNGVGIRRRFGMSLREVPWSEIETFGTVRARIALVVFVRLRSGEIIRTTLVQGRKMHVKGGSGTRDIVGLLNRHLAQSLGATDAGGSPP